MLTREPRRQGRTQARREAHLGVRRRVRGTESGQEHHADVREEIKSFYPERTRGYAVAPYDLSAWSGAERGGSCDRSGPRGLPGKPHRSKAPDASGAMSWSSCPRRPLSAPPSAWPPTTHGSGRSQAAFLPGTETPSAASFKPRPQPRRQQPPNCALTSETAR